jgi:very-short-patch-repair endonuclease
MYCLECNCSIPGDVYHYSNKNFGFPLCRHHQNWARNHKSTDEAITLYFLLKENGVPAELEKNDGHKSVDIVIEEAKVHIEVDGMHHNYDNRQALTDLKRTYHSFKKGYFTLRIPNSLMKWDAIETANQITDFLQVSKNKNSKRPSTFLGFFRR